MNLKTSNVQFTRLSVLADFLAGQVERKNFSMQRWGTSHVAMLQCRTVDFVGEVQNHCKTTACAGGYACAIPNFQREGLTMQCDGPRYRGQVGHAALREFFGLDHEQEHFLFGGYDKIEKPVKLTPKQWAKRCRAFLAAL